MLHLFQYIIVLMCIYGCCNVTIEIICIHESDIFLLHIRCVSEIKCVYPLNLSISIRGGKEI